MALSIRLCPLGQTAFLTCAIALTKKVIAPATSLSSDQPPVYGVSVSITSYVGDLESDRSESIILEEPLQVPGIPTNLRFELGG